MTRTPQSSSSRTICRTAIRLGQALALVVMLGSVNTAAVEARQTEEQVAAHAQRVIIRGLTWLQNGYADRAAAVFSEGLKIHPDNPALLASMASSQQAMGDLGTARFYLDQALRTASDEPALITQDLELSLAAGDPEAAARAVDRLLALGTLHPTFLLRHLTMLAERGPASLGITLATGGLERFPNDVAMAAGALRVFSERGDVDGAIQSARRLVSLRGTFDDRLRLTQLLMRKAAWNEAADIALSLLTEAEDDPEVLAILADLDARLPERDLAAATGLTWTRSEIRPDPMAPGDSLEIYRMAWQADPSDEVAMATLVHFLMQTDRPREAALLADEHVASYPRHLQAWTLAIDAWLASGDHDVALERSEDAILLFPGYAPIVLSRARVLAAVGALDTAVQLIDELVELAVPGSPEALAALALQAQLQQVP
jgi:tetratricopeptide (TPR) repeat protein